MAERRDPRRPRARLDQSVFHFDTGPRPDRQEHNDNTPPYTDTPHEDYGDEPGHSDWSHEDESHVDHGDDTDRLLDRVQSLLQSLELKLLTRQQQLERLVDDRLTGVEREAGRALREIGDHVQVLRRRVEDAEGRPPRGDGRE